MLFSSHILVIYQIIEIGCCLKGITIERKKNKHLFHHEKLRKNDKKIRKHSENLRLFFLILHDIIKTIQAITKMFGGFVVQSFDMIHKKENR